MAGRRGLPFASRLIIVERWVVRATAAMEEASTPFCFIRPLQAEQSAFQKTAGSCSAKAGGGGVVGLDGHALPGEQVAARVEEQGARRLSPVVYGKQVFRHGGSSWKG